MPNPARRRSPEVIVTRRPPTPSEGLDVLWRFAAERQRIFFVRAAGIKGPWTADPILQTYKFTNAYRASDRVSQYLLRRVIYGDEADKASPEDLVARVLLFKTFNRVTTWELIVRENGIPTAGAVKGAGIERALDSAVARNVRIFSAAYIMPGGSGAYAGPRKHRSYLSLIRAMLRDGITTKLESAKSLREVYEAILAYPMMGPFLAFQHAIDLNYTRVIDFDEDSFVVPGPGALDGLKKCFSDPGDYTPSELIAWTAERQERGFAQVGVRFEPLGNRRLRLIDVQNLFCETSKYTRVSHPHLAGVHGRIRIKQKFTPSGPVETPFYPPKWDVNATVRARVAAFASAQNVEGGQVYCPSGAIGRLAVGA